MHLLFLASMKTTWYQLSGLRISSSASAKTPQTGQTKRRQGAQIFSRERSRLQQTYNRVRTNKHLATNGDLCNWELLLESQCAAECVNLRCTTSKCHPFWDANRAAISVRQFRDQTNSMLSLVGTRCLNVAAEALGATIKTCQCPIVPF